VILTHTHDDTVGIQKWCAWMATKIISRDQGSVCDRSVPSIADLRWGMAQMDVDPLCRQVFTCVGALAIGKALHKLDHELLGWWLCERQCDSGGLNGRPEKQVKKKIKISYASGYLSMWDEFNDPDRAHQYDGLRNPAHRHENRVITPLLSASCPAGRRVLLLVDPLRPLHPGQGPLDQPR
jgi:hypothetical protein